MKLSPRVRLYPAGDPAPRTPGAQDILLPALRSSVFGDGRHPTTRLCAGAVDALCRSLRPARVLDVGTGTGVLARIARARGATRVVATDIDSDALACADENARLDACVPPIEVSDAAPDAWGPSFDLVVANILEGPLVALASPLRGALAPGGRLLISGFTPLQAPRLRHAFTVEGLTVVSESHLEGWALLCFERS